MLHLLSLTKWFVFIPIHTFMTIFHYKNFMMQNVQKFVFNSSRLDEVKVSWDDNTCELICKKCHRTTKDHMPLTKKMFTAVKL